MPPYLQNRQNLRCHQLNQIKSCLDCARSGLELNAAKSVTVISYDVVEESDCPESVPHGPAVNSSLPLQPSW